MSSQSGIQCSQELLSFLSTARNNESLRCFRIVIRNEQMVVDGIDYIDQSSSAIDFSQMYDNSVVKHLIQKECCFMFYRMDSKHADGRNFNWLFLHWASDCATIREKMLYASTKATLKKEFGVQLIADEISGHIQADINYAGYLSHEASKSAPPPLSLAELELKEVKHQEKLTALDGGNQTFQGIDFMPNGDADAMLRKFADGRVDFVHLAIDQEHEIIELRGSQAELPACQLAQRLLESGGPAYYIYRFRHEFESQSQQGILFIYCISGYSASIKLRMLYSSCKAGLLSRLHSVFEIEVERKMELDVADEAAATQQLEEKSLFLEFHPVVSTAPKKFDKPQGPKNRGARRIIKDPQQQTQQD